MPHNRAAGPFRFYRPPLLPLPALPPDTPSASPPPSRPAAASGFGPLTAGSSYPSFADTVQVAVRTRSPVASGTFDVCHPGLTLRAVLYVQAALIAGTLLVVGSGPQALIALGPTVFAGLFGTLAWLLLVCNGQRVLAPMTPWLRNATVLGLGAGCAVTGFALLLPFGFTADAVRWLALAGTGVLFAGALWTWLVLRVQSRLPAEAAARLAELQSRIRPHFLFNALNTAVALVSVDPERAEAVLEDLAQLFRVALEDHGQAVTLAEEVDLAQRYLAIEQLRFGDRLRVEWELDEAAGSAQVPPLLLQPLVENAVRHGIEPSPEGGDIVVRTRVRRGNAVIDITNTVAQQPSRPGHGMALQNVRERLQLLHDVAAQFETKRDKGRFRVRIEVPLS
jgi:two-component system sensor histidine kinase AlgZ